MEFGRQEPESGGRVTLALLWANPWVRRGLAVAAILGVCLFIRQHYINVGKEAGKSEAHQEQSSGIENHRSADRAEASDKIDALQVKIDALAVSADRDRQMFIVLASQRQQAATQVAGMSATQIQELINQALQRPANSTAPYTDQQQQAIASCFTQLPLCNQQVIQLSSQSKTLGEEIGEHKNQYGALADYTVALERDYTDLWNLNAKAKRKPWCLWLCKKAPQIQQPDPAKLKRPKPATR